MPAKFGILVERNFEVFFRRWRWALAEVLFMIIMFTIIVLNPTVKREDYDLEAIQLKKWTITKQASLTNTEYAHKEELQQIAYIKGETMSEETEEIINNAIEKLGKTPQVFDTEERMETEFKKDVMLCGIVIDNLKKTESIPKNFYVRLRFPNHLRSVENEECEQQNYWQYRDGGRVTADEDLLPSNVGGIYFREGFSEIQHAIFLAWYEAIQQNMNANNKMTIAFYDYPKDYKISRPLNSSGIVSFLYNFVFLFSFLNTVYLYGRHCQKNLLPHQWRYGYRYSSHWWANSFVTLCKLALLDIIIFGCLYIPRSQVPEYILFQDVNVGFFLLFLFLYNLQYLVCAIFYALIMQHGKEAVLLTIAVWFATYGCFTTLMQGNYEINNPVIIILLILHFNNCFPFGMMYLFSHTADEQHEFWIIFSCMLANVIIYCFIICWVQYLRPGRYMSVYKFDFLYLRELLRRKKKKDDFSEYSTEIQLYEKIPDWHNFEYGPLGTEPFVKLKNICSAYKLFVDRHHLKNISLSIFKGEITVLLGHHSSGKTSLVSIIAGWQLPQLGHIKFEGKNMHKNWKDVRQLCDVCMPNNALLDALSVKSTIAYFVRIKQKEQDVAYVRAETRRWLDVLKSVIPNESISVRKLDYDQKRLLCLCITLCCDTEIIILDEPTLRMKIQEQHVYWNILRAEKTDRVIVVTTFSTDVANFLGDRIAILDNGMLKAYGTPFFLKTKYSDAYYLVIMKQIPAAIVPITLFIEKYIPQATIQQALKERLVYNIPAEKRPLYQLMLLNLEKESESLGITKIFMFTSSLNEVCLSITKDKVKEFQPLTENPLHYRDYKDDIPFLMQVRAMIFKKMINQVPHFLPACMVLLTIFITIIIGRLSEVLPTPAARHEATKLGINHNLEKRSQLPTWSANECKFILIKNLDMDERLREIMSSTHFLNEDSYECYESKTFESWLKLQEEPWKKLAAIEFEGSGAIKLWANKREINIEPVIINLAHNILIGREIQNEDFMIKISNDPFLMDVSTKKEFMKSLMSHLRLPLIAGIVVPFIISCFIMALIEERRNHMWVLQRMAGLHLGVYYLVTFTWDWLTYFIFCLLFLVIQLLVHIEGVGYVEQVWVFLIIIIYGVPAIGWIYVLAMFMQRSKVRAFLISYVLSLATGIVAYNFYWDVCLRNDFLFYIFILSPHFAMLFAISSVYTEAKESEYCMGMCDIHTGCTEKTICLYVKDCCDMKNTDLTTAATFMILSAFLSFAALFIINVIKAERNNLTFKKLQKYRTACFPYDDADIKELRLNVARVGYQDIIHKTYIVDQVEYNIPKKPGLLYSISFELDKGDCLAIYGGRRSGSTHLARQLAGVNPILFGAIYVDGVEVKTDLLTAWKHLAYCPKDRGFYKNFTPREMLTYMCMISGVPRDKVKPLCRSVCQLLNMNHFVHKKCGHLSVEKQRKVNIAIALIISKDVLVIDQPTNGLPFSTCQEIWNALKYQLKGGSSFIFTSSEILECRVLASKMMLYERGEMLAYGGFFYLLDRFTRGIYLEVKLKRDGENFEKMQENFHKDIENLFRFITFMHGESELCSRVDNCLKFYLPVTSLKYSLLFGALEKNKHRLNISDYTINHGCIEEIFLSLIQSREHRQRRRRR